MVAFLSRNHPHSTVSLDRENPIAPFTGDDAMIEWLAKSYGKRARR